MIELFADDQKMSAPTKPLPMAYFPGTGPIGTSCGKCSHYNNGQCFKYRQLKRGKNLGKMPIPKYTSSCKYFDRQQKES